MPRLLSENSDFTELVVGGGSGNTNFWVTPLIATPELRTILASSSFLILTAISAGFYNESIVAAMLSGQ